MKSLGNDLKRIAGSQWFLGFLIFTIVFAVFSQLLFADFVKWDDDIIITKNDNLGPLSAGLVLSWFTSVDSIIPYYAPLSQLTWSLVAHLFGRIPFAYHLLSLLIHCVASITLFYVLRMLATALITSKDRADPFSFQANIASFLATLFWALSPLRVEQVAWASALSYGQSTLLLLLSLSFYLRHIPAQGTLVTPTGWRVASLVTLTLSILSHPITLPGCILYLMIDIVLGRIRFPLGSKTSRAALAEKLWFFGVSFLLLAVSVSVRFLGESLWRPVQGLDQLSLLGRIMQAAYSSVYYAIRPWFPFDLAPVYTTFIKFDPLGWLFVLSLVSVLLAIVAAVVLARRRPLIPVFLFGHLILSIPVLGLLEYPHFHSDRYMTITMLLYSIGFVLILLKLRSDSLRTVLSIAFCVILLIFSFGSFLQTRIWQSSEALLNHSIATLGEDPYRAVLYRRLCTVYIENGRPDEAVNSCREAVRINPVEKSIRLLQYSEALRSETLSDKSKRVLVIVIDTMRADGMGCYGYPKPTTPNIDLFAEESVVFEHHFAASPWTAPSFGSILSGFSPTVHRCGEHLSGEENAKKGENVYSVGAVTLSALADSVPLLGEILTDVKSGAIVNNVFLHPDLGINRGFDDYDLVIPFSKDSRFGLGEKEFRDASGTSLAATRWLENHVDESFFLLVHYIDPHVPYSPPEKYANIFNPNPTERFAGKFDSAYEARIGKLNATPEEKRQIRGLYDGEVRYVDEAVGDLLDALKRLNIFDNTWIVITSDHGEEIFDHGSFEHGHRYENEVTRVPLIIRPPKGAGIAPSRIPTRVRQIDLAPTVLEWFGTVPPSPLEGKSLNSLMTKAKSEGNRTAYMEYNLYMSARNSLVHGPYKLIRELKGGQTIIYDLESDPGEKEVMPPDHPAYTELGQTLDRYGAFLHQMSQQLGTQTQAIQLDDNTRDALKALGYIQDN